MNENWKDIQGYEGFYQISDRGRIRNRKEKILKFRGLNGGGYQTIELRKDGTGKKFRVHRLVAETFIPNPDNLPCVNHKDENKFNNEADNLEWCTWKYNANYGTRNERMVATKQKRRLLRAQTLNEQLV